MEIKSGGGYPSSSLSNFAGHRFIFDDVKCNSFEGFLQSLKFQSVEMQEYVCTLVGKGAKSKGASKNWKKKQLLFWKGIPFVRDGKEYTKLIEDAYDSMFDQSESFRNALKASGTSTLKHSMGKDKKSETVLTKSEFIGNLNRLREKL